MKSSSLLFSAEDRFEQQAQSNPIQFRLDEVFLSDMYTESTLKLESRTQPGRDSYSDSDSGSDFFYVNFTVYFSKAIRL